jgi:hypothetical protein
MPEPTPGGPDWESSRAFIFDCPAHAAASLCDTRAVDYLTGLLGEIRELQGWTVLPLLTLADGSCLVNAVAMSIWGSEASAAALRAAVCAELSSHAGWYVSQLEYAHPGCGETEHREACARAAAAGSFLSNVHMIALAHVLRRPLLLVASQEDMAASGVGYHGVAGTFLPVRWLREEEERAAGAVVRLLGTARPVVLAWGSAAHDHFVPLVPLAAAPDGTGVRAFPNPSPNQDLCPLPPCGFPVPTPTCLEGTSGPVDPFSTPHVPAAWFDALCRSCPSIYSGCWDVPYRRAGVVRVRTTLPEAPGADAAVQAAVRALCVLRHCASPADYATAVRTLHTMASNLMREDASKQERSRFRHVSMSNAAVHRRVGRLPGGAEVLLALGYRYVQGEGVLDGWELREGGLALELTPEEEDAEVVAAVARVLARIAQPA